MLKEIIPTYPRDNTRTRILLPDGSYQRLHPAEGQPAHRSQEEFIEIRSSDPAHPAVAGGGDNGASSETPAPAEASGSG